MSSEKNHSISESLKKTREKRLGQECRVFKIKIDAASLKTNQKEALKMQFIEAKWVAKAQDGAERQNIQMRLWRI